MAVKIRSRHLLNAARPWRRPILRLIGVALVFLMMWLAFETGRFRAGYDSVGADHRVSTVQEEMRLLQKKMSALRAENAELVSDNVIDSQAYKDVTQKLNQLNEEMLELKKELIFYRSILNPEEHEPGLRIQGVELLPTSKANTWRYKLVLMQRPSNDRMVSGRVDFVLKGKQGGRVIELVRPVLKLDSSSVMSFSFKYFETLEGQFQMPTDFVPATLIVKVAPEGSWVQALEQRFAWNSLVGGKDNVGK
ncbi:MAG: hypothetical protein H0W44_04580 [Gammaproteobacteria bacterium]|nr:hypothetical protein [Gammaproteobacteria bacterium]